MTAKAKAPREFKTLEEAKAFIQRQNYEIGLLKDALIKIGAGTGYYGSQAREYKNIALAALGQPTL